MISTESSPGGSRSPLEHQGPAVLIIFVLCVAMFAAAIWGDFRTRNGTIQSTAADTWSNKDHDNDDDNPDLEAQLSSAKAKGKAVESSETTPLLSPSPDPSVTGSASSSSQWPKSSLSWPSLMSDGSESSSSASQDVVEHD